MGLFDFLKKVSSGSYGLVTRKWTYTYCRLLTNHKDDFVSPDAMMTAASVINGNYYLVNNRFKMADLEECLHNAQTGICGVTRSMPTSYSPLEDWIAHGKQSGFNKKGEAEFGLMLNYCVQYVALLLAVDNSRMDSGEVIQAVVKGKRKIHDNLKMILRDITYGKANSSAHNAFVENMIRIKDPGNPVKPFMTQLLKDN